MGWTVGRRPAERRQIGRAEHALALRPACSAGTALAACWRSSGAGQACGAAPLKVGAGVGGGHAHAPGRADGLLWAGRHWREHARLYRGLLGRLEQVGVHRDGSGGGVGEGKVAIAGRLRGSKRRRAPGACGVSRCGDPRRVSGAGGPSRPPRHHRSGGVGQRKRTRRKASEIDESVHGGPELSSRSREVGVWTRTWATNATS